MFYLCDLLNGSVIKLNSEYLVAGYFRESGWQWPISNTYYPDFRNLNVTGKDTCISIDSSRNYVRVLRRYQVLDDYGRSIDIRNWSRCYWSSVKISYYRPWLSNGHKVLNRRVLSPSLRLRDNKAIDFSFDDLDLTPIKSKVLIRPRVKKLPSVDFDWYELKGVKKRSCSKSWKDQSKSKYQYARHYKRHILSLE